MLAKAIMTKNVIAVKKHTSTEEIARLLWENRISGVPVIDDSNRVVGIVSEGDLIYQVETMSPTSSYWENPKKFQMERAKINAKNAAEIMATEVVVAEEDTSVEEIATTMVERHVKRMPIVNKGKLVGIVTRQDVVETLLKSTEVCDMRW